MSRTYAEIGTITGTAQVLETPTPPLTARHLLGGVRAMSQSIIDRFMAKTAVDDSGCWVWQAYVDRHGYGRFVPNGRQSMLAHRWAYEHANGPIPASLEIDHLCRNRKCVNPAHLEPVTHLVNHLRGVASRRLEQTHCPHGHPFTPENTGWRKGTYADMRVCRTCDCIRHQQRRRKKDA